jgi:hypothetical protein
LFTHWLYRCNDNDSAVVHWLRPQAARIMVLPFDKLPHETLAPVLAQHFPGLPSDQAAAILERADGNPQFLAEIITFMEERKGLFERLDQRGALRPKGMTEVLNASVDRHKLNKKRFQDLPHEAQEALAIGSLQGLRLLQDLTAEVSESFGRDRPATLDAIKKAEEPHNLVRRDRAWAEFMQRLYREIAEGELPNCFEDESAVKNALCVALRRRVSDSDFLSALAPEDRQATLGMAWDVLRESPDEGDASAGAVAAATLIDERLAQHNYLSSGTLATRSFGVARRRRLAEGPRGGTAHARRSRRG